MAVTKIAIVGAGGVGTSLGKQLLKSGKFQLKYGAPSGRGERALRAGVPLPSGHVRCWPLAGWREVLT